MGQIDAYCYMVQRGKPAAAVQVLVDDLADALVAVQAGGCLGFTSAPEGEWVGLWIYQRPFMREIIETTIALDGLLPAKFAFWAAGCMFGYSLDAISAEWEELRSTSGSAATPRPCEGRMANRTGA